jgi:thymidylate kinase
MYLCLEGIKGTGKTTAYEEIKRKLNNLNIDYSVICPTRPLNRLDILESLTKFLPVLTESNFWRDRIYSHRSNSWALKALKEKKNIIVGDRSKLTSYVVKRMRGNTWEQALASVDKAERHIPLPDIVFHLTVDPREAYNRIRNRGNKNGIKEDESLSALMASNHLYNELQNINSFPMLSKIEWINLDGRKAAEQIANEAINVILKYLNKKLDNGKLYN